MSMLKDSSELKEALDLFRDFLDDDAPVVSRRATTGLGGLLDPPGEQPVQHRSGPTETRSAGVVVQSPPLKTPPKPLAPVEGEFRGDRLENSLIAMCQRGGFHGAVVADDSGLPLAVFNSPVEKEKIAAFTAVLGDAMAKAGRFLHEHGAEYISMDINYKDKVVVRSFDVLDQTIYLMVLCPQEMDERAEVELSLQQVASILAG